LPRRKTYCSSLHLSDDSWFPFHTYIGWNRSGMKIVCIRSFAFLNTHVPTYIFTWDTRPLFFYQSSLTILLFRIWKLPPYTMAGFDLTTLKFPSREETTRPLLQGHSS
jgi:hypothetical protein